MVPKVRLLHPIACLPLVRLRPMHVHSEIGRQVPDLSDPIWRRHAYCREQLKPKIRKLKQSLHDKFAMKELGQARHILGMRIERNRKSKTLWLSQSDYIHKVLKRFNIENAKSVSTPLPTTIRLSDKDSPSTEEERKLNGKIPYSSVVGSIMYAMVVTRPDLAYVVGVVSLYMSNTGQKHWEVVKHILRYLGGTKDAWLTFGLNNSTEVEGYTNSDYAGNMDNQKSTSGYVFSYGGGAISWSSKLQECTTKPSNTDHLLRLQERNTSHSKSSLPCEDETRWGTVSTTSESS